MQHTEETIRLIMGLKIRHLREERGITLSELGNRTGISVSYLNEIEKGKKHPKPSKAALIADALGTTYDKLVSLQLDKKLQPVAQLLSSNLLYDLQLEHFGLDPHMMVEHFAAAPDKLTAIISTIGEIARRSDINLESFYLATLRTYQEMHNNFFPELEEAAENLADLLAVDVPTAGSGMLFGLLQSVYGINVAFNLNDTLELASLRSLMVPAKKLLRVNSNLSEEQQCFVAARELAFQYMGAGERPLTSAWVSINHFEALQNNFSASYMAGAMLLPQDDMVEKLQSFFSQKKWKPELLEKMVEDSGVSPEMFLHRATSILPKYFGITRLFFLKFEHDLQSGETELVKELHMGGLHSPHAKAGREHHCGRWVSLAILHELAHLQQQSPAKKWLTGLQWSEYAGTTNKYLVLSMARSFYPTPSRNSSITIGMYLNDALRQTIRFIDDKTIDLKIVSNTCERCPVENCAERKAEPYILRAQQNQEKLAEALKAALD